MCCRSIATLFLAGFLMSGVASMAAPGAQDYLRKPAEWFSTEEAARAAGNILRNQTEHGGWPKNFDTTSDTATAPGDTLGRTTFDNGATLNELRFLARMLVATGNDRYREAFGRGLAAIFHAQYPTGGWPQVYPPPPKSYHRHITFNDGAMVNILVFLWEVTRDDRYSFVPEVQREFATDAFSRGIDCILKCQIEVNGQLTAWCAQHDEVDLSPRAGRKYELVSISGAESVGIVKLLMRLEDFSPEVVRAVESAVAWFERVKITGYRIEEFTAVTEPGAVRVAVRDEGAPPVWARMYDIATNEPLVSQMDGEAYLGLGEIGHGRRGYDWFGRWPARLLEVDYPRWKAKRARAAGE
jgi:PelA/Pel-15E family pectate lyase